VLLLAKNPAGWSEVLHFVAEQDCAAVIAVNARIADGKDPSWLWDVPYEVLHGHATAAAGERHLDVAVRLRYADVDYAVEPDPMVAARALPGERVFIIASYTQFSALYRRYGKDAA
jgi:UDP-N-acetylmuramyl tripeptide synthase